MSLLAGWHQAVVRVALASLVVVAAAGPLAAQIPANENWRTIDTEHFRVHFTVPLEGEARHAAAVAERAYSNLATELVRPRGIIDIVVTDGTDASNGSATTIPRPRVIIYARPPVDEPSLESYDDWTVLVLQHELTHVFHLDRSRGWWRTAQSIFGRNPVLFPNYYTPAWLTEGLAVYYESRFTIGGRLHGTFESSVARSAAADNVLPRLDGLSLAASRFPDGQAVYVYGSLLWDNIARKHGEGAVPAFVERSSGQPVPFFLDREARLSFGETFTHSWDMWRDSSLMAATGMTERPSVLESSRATVIPDGGRFIIAPRWVGDSALIFAANNGRETPGLYEARLGAAPVRMARRNSLDVNDPSHHGVTVFAQQDLIDRFRTRGDLYSSRNGREERLTDGARLSAPSVRADGEIVAVQTVPGSTRLVRVSSDGRTITPITGAVRDTQWAAPRWSPDGTRIVAVRIAGSPSDIVVMDSIGHVLSVPVRERAVLRSPAWLPDGRSILFTSDITDASQLYAVHADADFEHSTAMRLTAEPGGVYGADATRAGADSIRIVTTVLRGDGYHILVWTTGNTELGDGSASDTAAADAGAGMMAPGDEASPTPKPEPVPELESDPRWRVTDDTGAAHPYSPWRTLIPAYWSPTLAEVGAGRGVLVGALTSASDVIGRHSYIAEVAVNTHDSNVNASLNYTYGRWTNPLLSVSAEQSWSYRNIAGGGRKVGDLGERSRFVSLHATFARPRVRTYSAVTVGAEFESDSYVSSPGGLLSRLDPFYAEVHRYPTLVAAAVFSNTQRPALSISPEDGVSITGSVRQRWEGGSGSAGRSAVAVASAYKSLNLPGFAHHVLALRAAIGVADSHAPGDYEAGGVSGQRFEIVPGISFGSAARTFPARGFPAAAETGISASSVSAEYRVPLFAPSRSPGLFPFFLDRASLAFFGDAARASCPARSMPACSPSATDGPTLASIGAELNLDSALQFDVPYRFRLGLAHPVHGAAYAGASSVSAYATLGLAF